MLTAIKGLVGSKKFWLTIIGSAAVGGLGYVHAPQEIIVSVASLFGIGVVGQGMADFGKSSK